MSNILELWITETCRDPINIHYDKQIAVNATTQHCNLFPVLGLRRMDVNER